MSRTRSEYRLDGLEGLPTVAPRHLERPTVERRDGLAQLLLDAYRGTIDDEGEDLDDAREAIDHYFGAILPDHSVVLVDNAREVAMSLVLTVDGVHYIDPVAVAASHARRGLGRDLVLTSLRSLAAAGVDTAGATITDGNVASERLFSSLGFQRVGSWD